MAEANKVLGLTLRVEILPTNEQRTMLDGLADAQKLVYNMLFKFNSDAGNILDKYISEEQKNNSFLSKYTRYYLGCTISVWQGENSKETTNRKKGSRYRTVTKHTKVIDLTRVCVSLETLDTGKDCLVFMPIYAQLKGTSERVRRKEKALYSIKLAESGRLTQEILQSGKRVEVFKVENGKRGRYYICVNVLQERHPNENKLLQCKETFSEHFFMGDKPVYFDRRQRPVRLDENTGKLATFTGEEVDYYRYITDSQEVCSVVYTVPSLGVDVGVKVLAYLSDNTVIPAVDDYLPYKKVTERLNNLMKMQKKYKIKSTRLKLRIKKLQSRQYYIKKQYFHVCAKEFVTRYVNQYVIQMEQLTQPESDNKGSQGSRLMTYKGAYLFQKYIGYKLKKAGGSQCAVNKYEPSSKRCFCCGAINEGLSLDDRVYECKLCGYVNDRDFNAALNLAAWQRSPSERMYSYKQRKYSY